MKVALVLLFLAGTAFGQVARLNRDALVAYWPFEEMAATTPDRSGNNHTGFLSNGVTTVSSPFGQAAGFEGLTRFISVPGTTSLLASNTGNWGVAAWFRTQGRVGGSLNYIYCEQATNSANPLINISAFEGGGAEQLRLYLRNAAGTELIVTAPPVVKNNVWRHMAATKDGTVYSLYLDGVLIKRTNFTGIGTVAVNAVMLAARPGISGAAPSQYFFGGLDEVKIYSRAMSDAEVSSLSNSRRPSP